MSASDSTDSADSDSTLQRTVDLFLRYRWLGILGYAIFLSPLALLLLSQIGLGNMLPTQFSFRAESPIAWVVGPLIALLLVIYTAVAIIRSFSNRQIGWLIAIVVCFPIALLYLLFGYTARKRAEVG